MKTHYLNEILKPAASFGVSSSSIDRSINLIFEALKAGDLSGSISMFEQLIEMNLRVGTFPNEFLMKQKEAIERQDWNILSTPFREMKFVGKDGRFLVIAPYGIRRRGVIHVKLTGIYGSLLNLPTIDLRALETSAEGIVGTLGERPAEITSVVTLQSFGMTGDEKGEAFLVPNGWIFRDSELGPALNDLSQQRRRFLSSGRKCIQTIFDSDSAEFLLGWSATEAEGFSVQAREYQYHEIGHASGFGLTRKIKDGIFRTAWYAAVEEWRSDGVAFELLTENLDTEQSGKTIAANLCLRFGVDSQRIGGPELDSDVNASLILLDRLLEGGSLRITRNKKLRLADLSYEGLARSVKLSSLDAIQLTRSELELSDLKGIWNLYGTIRISRAARQIFDSHVIGPCNGFFRNLQ